MFWNYIKVSLRNIWRHRIFSLINILGLAMGIASCLLIVLYVGDDISYDRYHENYDNLYRINTQGKFATHEFSDAKTPPSLAFALIDEYPEIKKVTRVLRGSNKLVSHANRSFTENRFYYADSTFFDVFTFPIIKGDPKRQLNKPHTIVITEATAKRYFDDDDPIGKSLALDNGLSYKVTGVCKNVPDNSHFHFDFVAATITYDIYLSRDLWLEQANYTYFLLEDGYDPDDLEAKLPGLVDKYLVPVMEKTFGISAEEFAASGQDYRFKVQPLKDIHLQSRLDNELELNGDIRFIYIFSIIASLVLIIAIFNFMNLSTARSESRSKEVAVRKMVGSQRRQLIMQFLAESVIISIISLLIALVIVELVLPWFNIISHKNLNLQLFNNWVEFPLILLASIFIGIIAGSYPALYLTSFEAIEILNQKKKKGTRRSWLRNVLVFSQFFITTILLIGTFVIYKQLNFIQSKELGFDKEKILILKRAYALEKKKAVFKEEMLQNSRIRSASYIMNMPGEKGWYARAFWPVGEEENEVNLVTILFADEDLGETFGISMKEGRFFEDVDKWDSMSVIINQSGIDLLGLDSNILGRGLYSLVEEGSDKKMYYTIVGVFNDIHHQSLHQEVEPMVILPYPVEKYIKYLALRVENEKLEQTIDFLKTKWDAYVPGQPFDYLFLNEQVEELYQSEKIIARLFIIFSMLTVFIACLGLFGLALFTSEQRTREIGIRKAHGASVMRILLRLFLDFTRWVVYANLLAWPVAYLLARYWLSTFAYHTPIPLWIFPAVAAITILISLLTITYQAQKSARANPVDALRYE